MSIVADKVNASQVVAGVPINTEDAHAMAPATSPVLTVALVALGVACFAAGVAAEEAGDS